MRVLVTGGTGYIGSHLVRLLAARGDHVVIVDDLENGVAARVPGVHIETLELSHSEAVGKVRDLLASQRIDAVAHFAARKQVAESMVKPAWYYQQNLGGLANLLLAMEQAGVRDLVFSSSAAVYGSVEGDRLGEDEPTIPINPYGQTKLVGEWLVDAAVRTNGFRAASLRYFNVAGAGWPELGDMAALNLVPMVFERIEAGQAPIIFGDDYATADGTCVRDYIHVLDLAEAHLAVLDRLKDGHPAHQIYNVGTGRGYSVREMITEILRVTGSSLAPEIQLRRVGDPATVVADPSRIRHDLGWGARLTLTDMVQSAWDARRFDHLYSEH